MAKQEISYAGAMARIEEILARFNEGELDVDTLAAEVKQATELIKFCRARLLKAEQEVSEILKDQ
ncbi:MAG: exodeoxyribonuclease VII small subunit [Alistipes sp.]|nr:exodeoxyribonuclease VII small subunit [Alistipes sp.]